MKKKMEDIPADRIDVGSDVQTLRALKNELMASIAKDEDLNHQPSFHFNLYFNLIHMIAAGYDPSKIIYLICKHSLLGLPEGEIYSHISKVRSDYGDFLEIMTAIINSKLRDFIKLGASKAEAYCCVEDWISQEFR